MKNLLFTLLAITILFVSSCEEDSPFVGSDTIVTETRTVTGFDRILLTGVVDVNIVEGTNFSVTVRGNDNLLDQIETQLRDATLEIGLASGNFRNITADVDIVMPSLAGLELTATADAAAQNFSNLSALTVDISGTGSVSISNSSTDLLTANLSGTGDMNAFGLTATTAEVNTTGSGSAELTVTNSFEGTIAGTGDVRYRGFPRSLFFNITGSGELVDAN